MPVRDGEYPVLSLIHTDKYYWNTYKQGHEINIMDSNNLLYINNDKLYRYKSEEIVNVKETDNILNIPSSYILLIQKMSSNK